MMKLFSTPPVHCLSWPTWAQVLMGESGGETTFVQSLYNLLLFLFSLHAKDASSHEVLLPLPCEPLGGAIQRTDNVCGQYNHVVTVPSRSLHNCTSRTATSCHQTPLPPWIAYRLMHRLHHVSCTQGSSTNDLVERGCMQCAMLWTCQSVYWSNQLEP